MSEESLSLDELQAFRKSLEDQAQRLRQQLHDLRRERPVGWQEEFTQTQEELVEVATRIAELKQRIRLLVEGAIVTEEDDGDV